MDGWIVIPNWHRFQHYKDRVPPWIKVHLETLDDPKTEALTNAQMGVLIRVWMLYARCRGTLSTQKVCSALAEPNVRRHLARLNDAGLIVICASELLAQRRVREEKRGSSASTQIARPRTNAAAYRSFVEADPDPELRLPAATNDPVDEVEFGQLPVDQEMLELARGWMDEHPA